MNPPRVLVVGGKAKNLEAARRAGCDVVHVQHVAAFTPRHAQACDQALLVDYTDLRVTLPLVETLHRLAPLAYAVSFTEAGLVPAGALRDALGLPGPSAAVSGLLRDKAAMRRALTGHPVLDHPAAVATTDADVLGFARGRFPVVLKPIDGAGSRSIQRVERAGQVGPAVAAMHAAGYPTFLAERFAAGPEYSVEAMSHRGEHQILAITEKFVGPGHVEVGHVVPGRLSEAAATAVREVVACFLDAVGVGDGLSHTEVIVTPVGPVVVESHDRVGGDRISELVSLATGVHPVESLFRLAAGTAAWPLRGEPVAPACAIWFLTPEPGLVERVDGVDEARALAGVVEVSVSVAAGDPIAPVTCSADRSGWVVATGIDAAEAVERARRAAARVTFRLSAA
ncbi:ATP-grasp domain-containing protein [Micromonospora humi]|uniref:Biotin carboxylase n=1 Tax=Micromonospora humi TaxID=745366 RepID=A0A1C5JQ69_9ACTN|nr:ATP-grasp domain-containing protein [Micromonospora humi]SCG72379.1 Biotin carboxylase [Micromonospora humi]